MSAVQLAFPSVPVLHKFKVELWNDEVDGHDSPNEWDGAWKLWSFDTRNHRLSLKPEAVGFNENRKPSIGLLRKLSVGTAFLVDYQEHGRGEWSLSALLHRLAAQGDLAYWENASYSGILICDNPKNLGAKTFSDREKDAERFCETFTCWVNGDIYGYTLWGADGEDLDSCGGFYGNDRDYMVEQIHDHIRVYSAGEPLVEVEVSGNAEYLWKEYVSPEVEAARRLGYTER